MLSLLGGNGRANEPEVYYAVTEVREVQEYPLKIVCWYCGYVFYYLTIPELFDGEIPQNEWFVPASRYVKPWNTLTEWQPCPKCKRYPARTWHDKKSANGFAGMMHTNKGWQPTRTRPRI